MSAENKEDLPAGNDDLARICEVKIKVEVGPVGESEDEDWVPLKDPLSPSSDFVPTTRRYETRKRHAKTVLFEGSDSNSDKGSDWEPEEGETRQKNIKRVKIIKVDDGLSCARNQAGTGEQEKKVGRGQSKERQKKKKSVNSAEVQKGVPERKEHSKPDDGVTETLESTMSEGPPEKNVQRKRQGSKMTPEERRKRQRVYQRLRRQKLQSGKKVEVTGEVELDVRYSVRRPSQQTYLERLEAKNAQRREASRKLRENMTPEERAERNRKVRMANAMKNAAMTEEQMQEKRQKEYLWKVIRRTKQSAEEFEAMRKKQRARSLAYRRKMLEERREEFLAKGREYMKKHWKTLSVEERRRRIAKSQENARRRRTPEQRERKRLQTRLCWAKYDLRQKLAAEGVPPEQIAEKVKEFVANFPANPRPFPSQRKRKKRTNYGRAPVKLQLEPELLARIEPAEQVRVEQRFNAARTYLRKKLEKAGVPPEEMEEKFKELQASYEKFGRLDGEDYRPPPKLKPNETPEQRDARVMKARVAVAKCSLRKRLTAEGEPPEVIEEKLRELVSRYEAKAKEPITFTRPHKPRAKQKRWIRNESEVATCQDSPQAAASVRPPTEESQASLSPYPSSPNSYCEPNLPDSNPASPQIDEYPQMLADQPKMMHPELKMATVQFCMGNNDRGSSTLTSTFEQQVDFRQHEETFPPRPPEPISPSTPPPEADLSDDGFEQDEHIYQEKFVPPRPKKTRRRSSSRGSVKRRTGPPDGPRGSYKAKEGPVVTCEFCGNAYSPEYIATHKKLVHNPNWVNGKCVACGMEFSVGHKFLVHYNSAHVYPTLPKGKDGKVFLPRRGRRREFTSELERAFNASLVVCKLCGMSVPRSEILKHKKVDHHPNYKEGKCTLCNTEFQGGVAFYEHFQREHRDGKRKWERKQNFVCPQCGDGFYSAQYLSTHEYSVHGDGSKEENFPQCPFCVNKFRSQASLNEHLKNVHPEEECSIESRRARECRRCGAKCRTNKALSEHVSARHPDSYFPCPNCERVMYTEQNLNDHFLLCKVKRSGGEEEDRLFSKYLETVPLPCEFCSREMGLSSLKRHYRVVHGVVEEPWRCCICSQTFSRRNFWLNHLDWKHGMPLDDELKEVARKMNVTDRSQVEIKNLKGIRKRRVYKNNGKRKSKSMSPKKSMDSCSEDGEDKERTSDEEEIDETSEDEGDARKNNKASLRRSTRSGGRSSRHIKPEVPQVKTEKRLVISLVRLSEKEISKWTNRSDIIVCKIECE